MHCILERPGVSMLVFLLHRQANISDKNLVSVIKLGNEQPTHPCCVLYIHTHHGTPSLTPLDVGVDASVVTFKLLHAHGTATRSAMKIIHNDN